MLSGKRFRLKRDILALRDVAGKTKAVTIPAGDVVKVVAEPSTGKRMVDLLWKGQLIEMFTVDLEDRSSEVSDHEDETDRIASA